MTPDIPAPSSRNAIVASDQHLGAAPAARVQAFHAWLDTVADRTRHLVLNGDLFDFWFEYGSVIPKGYTRTLGKLVELVDGGVRVDFIGGNHDWWGGSFLRNEIGLHVHHAPVRLELGGRTALVAHGDGLGQGDLGYRALRSVLRSRLARLGFRWVHPDVGAWIAGRVSRTGFRPQSDHAAPPARLLERSAALERWARDTLVAEDNLELVLLGHTHLPRKVEVAPGRFYLNSGDWLVHCTWVELEPGARPRLLEWNGGDPRPFSARSNGVGRGGG
jgi:UDP-2,3-diacylglucosamine hydrolase